MKDLIRLVTVFLLMGLTYPLFAADISVRLTLSRQEDRFILTVKNTGNNTFNTENVKYIFNNALYSNDMKVQLIPDSEQNVDLGIATSGLNGSYNLSLLLNYWNESTLCSLVINSNFSYQTPSTLPLEADIQTESIYIKGKYKIEFKNPALIPFHKLLLPEELKIIGYQKIGNTVEYTISNANHTFNNRYTIYLTVDREDRGVHSANFISKSVTTGVYYFHYDKVLWFAIVTNAIAVILLLIGLLLGFKWSKQKKEKGQKLIFGSIVFFLAFLVYFSFYYFPNSPYWDENYHVVSAQKYIGGVMYMEPHPPLGKMFIALGEFLINPNPQVDSSEFVNTDYLKKFPADYSFMGVRFFPVLFAVFSAVFLYLIFLGIVNQPLYAFLFSFLYIFDNALVVHLRGAMLDPAQLFFILVSVFYFITLTKKKVAIWEYGILGLLVGLSMAVKVNSTILLLLFVFLALYEYGKRVVELKIDWLMIREFALKVLLSIMGVGFSFLFVFYLHFAIGGKVVDGRYYHAGDAYKKILAEKQNASPFNIPVMLADSMKYMEDYQKRVPKLDVCKEGENGSYPMDWLVGSKTINYAWSKTSAGARYLYLVSNPLVWFLGLFSVILSLALILGRLFFGVVVKNNRLFWLITSFTVLYVGYMGAVIQIERVMYLYHYFIPLLFSFILAFLNFNYIFEEKIQKMDKITWITTVVLVGLVVVVFAFYAPLTYYQPLTADEFFRRVWFSFWRMKNV